MTTDSAMENLNAEAAAKIVGLVHLKQLPLSATGAPSAAPDFYKGFSPLALMERALPAIY